MNDGRVRFFHAMCLAGVSTFAVAQSSSPAVNAPKNPCRIRSTIERSSQTGESYRGLINHGGAKARKPRIANARYKNARFGIERLRIDSRTLGVPPSRGSLCMPILRQTDHRPHDAPRSGRKRRAG